MISRGSVGTPKLNRMVIPKDKVHHYIEKGQAYEEANNIFIDVIGKSPIEESQYTVYKAKISNQSQNYVGLLNDELRRHGKGVNSFENKDLYIGDFESDMMEGEGFYIKKESRSGELEIFKGQFRSNKKCRGLMLWITVEANGQPAWKRFDIFYGDFMDEIMHDGYFFSFYGKDQVETFSSFRGQFKYNSAVEKILKEGENCLYYRKKENRVIQADLIADNLQKAIVFLIDPETGSIGRSYSCEYANEDNQRNKVKSYEQVIGIKYKEELKRFVDLSNRLMGSDIEQIKSMVMDILVFRGMLDLDGIVDKIERLQSYNFKDLNELANIKIIN